MGWARSLGSWTAWRRLALVLVGLEVLYLVVANLVLLTPLAERWANHGPNRRVGVTWSGAWTVVPTWVHASSLVVERRSGSWPWSLRMSSVNARIGVLPLFGRRLVLGGLVGDVEARVGEEGGDGTSPGTPRRPRRKPSGWELVLDDVVATGSHRLVLEEQGLEARVDGRLEASLDSRFGQWVELPAVRLHGTGFVQRDGVPVLELLEVDGGGRFERFDPRGRGAVEKLESFDGEIALSGTVRESGALGARLPQGITFERGSTVRATLDVHRGRLEPGTELDLADTRVEAALLGFVAAGGARAHYRVRRDGGGTVGRWTVELEKVALRRDPDAPPDVLGSLRVESMEREPFLFRRPEGLTTRFDLHDASIPDLAVLDELIPPRVDVAFEKGRGRLRSRLTVAPDMTVSGTMQAEITGLVAKILGYEVRGALNLEFALDHGDPQARSFDLADAELRFRDGRLRTASAAGGPEEAGSEGASWWMSGRVPSGTVQFGSPLTLSAATKLRMSDLRPVVAFLTHKSKLPGALAFASKIENVAAEAQVDLDDEGLRITHAALVSDQLDVHGSLRVTEGGVRGGP